MCIRDSKYADIEETANVRIVAVSRLGTAMLLTPGLVAQEGDLAFFAIASQDVDGLHDILAAPISHGH